jgi:hypothetical protein
MVPEIALVVQPLDLGQLDVGRRWVMSTTTRVSPVSGVPTRPADQGIGPMTVAYVPGRLARPGTSR